MENNSPNPGTVEAINAGCVCPVIDNNHGKGVIINGNTCFWLIENCPIHSAKKEEEKVKTDNRIFLVNATVEYNRVEKETEEFSEDGIELPWNVEQKINDCIYDIVKDMFEDSKYEDVDGIEVNNLNWSLNVEAVIDYDIITEKSEDIQYKIELPAETNEDDIDELLEKNVETIFLQNFSEEELKEISDVVIYFMDYEELPPISPMKVMELEGEKKLFDDSELDPYGI